MSTLEVSEYLTAAALRSAGAALIDAQPNERGRVTLLFDDCDGTASRLLREHRAGTLQVSSREMADAVDSVKREIFGAKGR